MGISSTIEKCRYIHYVLETQCEYGECDRSLKVRGEAENESEYKWEKREWKRRWTCVICHIPICDDHETRVEDKKEDSYYICPKCRERGDWMIKYHFPYVAAKT